MVDKMYNFFVSLSLIFIINGCVPTEPEHDEGEKAPKSAVPKDPFQAIPTARITLSESAGMCSGVLILENLILTAGHCFDLKSGKIPKAQAVSIVKSDGTMLNIQSGQIVQSGEFFPAETHLKDIGFIKLASGVTQGVSPLVIGTGVHALPADTEMSFFGYSSNVWAKMTRTLWEPKAADIAVTLSEWRKWTVVADLKSTASITEGDSGGPIVIKKQDQWILVGVLQGPGVLGHYTFTPAENALAEIAAKAGTSAKTLVAH